LPFEKPNSVFSPVGGTAPLRGPAGELLKQFHIELEQKTANLSGEEKRIVAAAHTREWILSLSLRENVANKVELAIITYKLFGEQQNLPPFIKSTDPSYEAALNPHVVDLYMQFLTKPNSKGTVYRPSTIRNRLSNTISYCKKQKIDSTALSTIMASVGTQYSYR